jgi:hypothetical protein
MVRKSPDKQWNRQNSILFHETIPLSLEMGLQCKVIVSNVDIKINMNEILTASTGLGQSVRK